YDGVDNDGDAIIDYPADPGCFYAADATEEDECIPGVPFIDLPPDGHLLGTTTVTGSFVGSCTAGFTTSGGEDVVIFTMTTTAAVTLTTNLAGTTFDTGIYLRSLCDDTTSEIACNDNAPGSFSGSTIVTTLGPGTYFLFVDGLNGAAGSYELDVSGTVAGGAPCDPTSLVFTCDAVGGFACSDPGTGTFVCTAGACSNTLDDDGDALADFPLDPGCTTLADADETDTCPGAGCPQCANGTDDDGDAFVDYPADTGCVAASDDDEQACVYDFAGGAAMGWTFTNSCTSGVGWTIDDFRSVSPMHSLYYGNPVVQNYDCTGGPFGTLASNGTAVSSLITLPVTGSEVTFWVYYDTEPCGFDDLTLQVDPMGAPAPVQVWDRCSDAILSTGSSGAFIMQTVNLSAYNGMTVQLGFVFDTGDDIANSTEGVYVDDVFANGACP
ncbi:MAG TPA: hypothetical protein VG389_10150, partial [Myxococcota bacterium]|nr:hypothetical protein [Myxococcota bacterium]